MKTLFAVLACLSISSLATASPGGSRMSRHEASDRFDRASAQVEASPSGPAVKQIAKGEAKPASAPASGDLVSQR
jgi:hypothetical protein